MIKVVGVRFRTAGKIYFFDPGKLRIKRGDFVIVETARGIEFGTVVGDMREVEEDKVIQPLKPVIRIANQRDIEQEAANKVKEKEAYQICLEKIRKHGLEMKLIDAEYTFDNNKVLFYFTADGRIDFRELVKVLANHFHILNFNFNLHCMRNISAHLCNSRKNSAACRDMVVFKHNSIRKRVAMISAAAATNSIAVVEKDKVAVCGNANVGFDTEIASVACRNECGSGVFSFETGKTSVRNEQSGIFIDFNGINVIPTFLTVIIT